MIETVVVNPDPKRLIEGLRDTGYNFCTAVADLIDNSIAAFATKIYISIHMDYIGNVDLMIADNGCGMSKKELITAMKYGSPPDPSPRSLGKFGLGMKTSSTAFCKRFSVISTDSSDRELSKATWDLDHVSSRGKWELQISSPDDVEIDFYHKTIKKGQGTIIRWEKVDRLLKEYSNPGGHFARKALEKNVNELIEHVSMVYQRFLNHNDTREEQELSIKINDHEVLPWDPFCIGESELAAKQIVPLGHEDENDVLGEFIIKAYILPRKGQFSSEEAEKSARISNDRQGFYVYRENRLIHHSDWMGMYSNEPHFSLLRIEFSFGSELDEAFQVDIKKSKINLADELYRWLKDEFLPSPRRAAEQMYRKGVKSGVKRIVTGAHDDSNKGIGNTEQGISQAEINVLDPESGDSEITNPYGKTRVRIKIARANKPGEVYVQPVDGIDDGLLWQPAFIEQHQAVQINTGHDFYNKVYVPNIQSQKGSSITIQGIDSLLWALAVSELKAVNEATKNHFDELRYEVSRILRKLVQDLPDPDLDENDV
jgi:hypothetical protein